MKVESNGKDMNIHQASEIEKQTLTQRRPDQRELRTNNEESTISVLCLQQ